MIDELQQLGRREWWLWFSAFAVTTLSGIAFFLTAFPSLFFHKEHFFEIRSDQARWGVLCLLLLFNAWLVFRQWSFRLQRRRLAAPAAESDANLAAAHDPTQLDPLTGLHTRASVEQQLGREVAYARRHSTSLTIVAFHLDDFAQLSQQFGAAACDTVLKDFARRLRKASRGSDFGVRLASDDFLLILPDCGLKDAKTVSDRLGNVEVSISGQEVELAYSVGWIDYKPGEVPSDLFKRAGDVLHLYKRASKDTLSSTLLIQ
ncbi:MAG TPA: GGDEF domain-containing protein [Candidatus Acidoferrales bacterium]|nr:GGDEF domain-containing protein [Candidatus Acidoferrales bacterium]